MVGAVGAGVDVVEAVNHLAAVISNFCDIWFCKQLYCGRVAIIVFLRPKMNGHSARIFVSMLVTSLAGGCIGYHIAHLLYAN